jgi:hypothetical protein
MKLALKYIALVTVIHSQLLCADSSFPYLDWKLQVSETLYKTTASPFPDPQWKIVNPFTIRHFQLLSAPLAQIKIALEPPKSHRGESQIPVAFELVVIYPDGHRRSLRFISHLEKRGNLYVNDHLVINRKLPYEVRLLNHLDDELLAAALDPLPVQSTEPEVKLGFTAEHNLYQLAETYTQCHGAPFLFTYYGFVESTLSRKAIKSCGESQGTFILDQKDWLAYHSIAYQLEKVGLRYYIALKNDLTILEKGRNPSHVKLLSPDAHTAMLTSATFTIDSFSGDDWFIIFKGTSAVSKIRKVVLQDLLLGQYGEEAISQNIRVFSSGTLWEKQFDRSANAEIQKAARPYDAMVLNDLKGAQSFVTFYNPVLINIGQHDYYYDRLCELLSKLSEKGVQINSINSDPHIYPSPHFKRLMKSGRFHSITPYYRFDKSRSIGTVHTRLINIDARVCYLFTGHLANVYTNELGFRIESTEHCLAIKNHLEHLYGKTDLEAKLSVFWLGILKLFRLESLHSPARTYNFLVNGKEIPSLDLGKLQPIGNHAGNLTSAATGTL